MTAIAAATIVALAVSAPAAAQQTVVRPVSRGPVAVAQAGAAAGASQHSDFKFEQKDVQTQKLAIGTNGDISLRNIVGDITVKTGGGREATLEIVKLSRGLTEADAKLGLEKVTVDVAVSNQRATVEAKYPEDRRPNYAVSVSYNVTAPAGSGVTLDTISGHLSVTGLQGDVSAHAISGRVELTGCTKVSSARTTSGDIVLSNVQSAGDLAVEGISGDLRLTGIKARRLTASIISGTITASEIQVDGASMGTMSGDITFSGAVTSKGRYEFRAQSGTVKLGLTGGFDFEARTFSGKVQADASLGMTSTTGNTAHSIRGTTGNGGASVLATTFSGSVWVGRKIN
jgi:DUF4097 and DUF4098 domain-containing protein YvlB